MKPSIGVLKFLATELQYLVVPALKYGVHQDDVKRGRFVRRIKPEDMEELASVAGRYRINGHRVLVGEFLDNYPMTEYAESAKLYWLFAVMDECGLALSSENWNTVEEHIKSLRRFGSFRLASERANAALLLANFGNEAISAVPYLQQALQDEDLRVRMRAHFALAVIEGNRMEYERAVRRIYAKHNKKDEYGLHIEDVGADADDVLEKFAEL